MTSISKGTSCGQIFYDFYWGSGFIPSKFQGVKFRGGGDPVLYLKDPDGLTRTMRRGILDDVAKLNEMKLKEYGDPEIATRIAQYEMAFKMQASVPELTDLSGETKETLDMYGPSVQERGTFAHNCLMARRLIERGVRCVQLMHAGLGPAQLADDRALQPVPRYRSASAALVKDLKRLGLLDDTLVIWAASSGAHRSFKETSTTASAGAAIITRTPSPSGWLAAV